MSGVEAIIASRDALAATLRTIIKARDDGAEGVPPPFGEDQAFDDWAADLAQAALAAADCRPAQSVRRPGEVMSPPGGSALTSFYADLCCVELDKHVTRFAGQLALGEAKPSTHACISWLIHAVRQRVEALTPETSGRKDTLRLGARIERLVSLAATTINTKEGSHV